MQRRNITIILIFSIFGPGYLSAQSIYRGSQIFETHCASCHGRSARGDGDLGSQLPVPPTDLTALQPSGKKFPEKRVRRVITGQYDIPGHTEQNMPVWGRVFWKLEDARQAKQNINDIIWYLKTLQER